VTGSPAPGRVLVLSCPDWPDPETGPAGAAAAAESSGARSGPGPGPSARAFEPVVAVVEEFCPKVEVLRPGTCAISVRGPARYFGGESELVAKIAAAVRAAGFAGQIGVADGLFAAELAAALGTDDGPGAAGRIVPPGQTVAFLAAQPVSALGRPELGYLLPRLGITTLGEFAALPADEAANRFGASGEIAHRLARGLDPRPLAPRPPAADLSVRQEFDPPAGQSEPVVFAAKSLAEDLHARLAAMGLACVRIQVQVHCADGREISRFWRHDGLLSGLAVAERVRWQLDGWHTQADSGDAGRPDHAGRPHHAGRPDDAGRPDHAGRAGHAGRPDHAGRADHAGRPDDARGAAAVGGAGEAATEAGPGAADEGAIGGITLLRLVPDQLVRATGRQLRLWGDAVVTDQVARAAIRVQAMLGHGAVMRPVRSGGRRPADQTLLVPFGDAGVPSRPADRPWPGQIPAPAPATVYPAPQPAWVTDSAGTAVSVTARAQLSAPPAWLAAPSLPAQAITSWAGPWPVSESWWDPAQARRQARFQLVTEDGRAWLAALQDGCWLIEASYD
jgi:protein ImuB